MWATQAVDHSISRHFTWSVILGIENHFANKALLCTRHKWRVHRTLTFGSKSTMTDLHLRMTDTSHPPTLAQVEAWIGKRAYGYWTRILSLIDCRYPGVFRPEWIYGGRKHGWALRFKKSKSFCTLIPERKRFALLLVFGRDERAKVEALQNDLSSDTIKQYYEATTYHDGKWLLMIINTDSRVSDVDILFKVKRKPKR